MTDNAECPECNKEGIGAWVLGHWYCPPCDIEYTDSGELTDMQAMSERPASEILDDGE